MALIHELMPKVMASIGAVGKDGFNAFHKYQFRSLDDVYNAVHPALLAHGVTMVPKIVEYRADPQEKGFHVFLLLQITFYAPDGASIEAVTLGEGADASDKAANKAMSAAFKYAVLQSFCIPTVDLVNDGDKDSPDVSKARTVAPHLREIQKKVDQVAPFKTADFQPVMSEADKAWLARIEACATEAACEQLRDGEDGLLRYVKEDKKHPLYRRLAAHWQVLRSRTPTKRAH